MARKLAKEQKTKDLTKEQAKELSYDTVNDLVIDSAIVLAEDLANEKDDSVKVFYNSIIISKVNDRRIFEITAWLHKDCSAKKFPNLKLYCDNITSFNQKYCVPF